MAAKKRAKKQSKRGVIAAKLRAIRVKRIAVLKEIVKLYEMELELADIIRTRGGSGGNDPDRRISFGSVLGGSGGNDPDRRAHTLIKIMGGSGGNDPDF